MITIERTSRQGQPAITITCACATHTATGRTAIITGPAADGIAALTGKARTERVHGFVTLANHPAPMIRARNACKGIFAS